MKKALRVVLIVFVVGITGLLAALYYCYWVPDLYPQQRQALQAQLRSELARPCLQKDNAALLISDLVDSEKGSYAMIGGPYGTIWATELEADIPQYGLYSDPTAYYEGQPRNESVRQALPLGKKSLALLQELDRQKYFVWPWKANTTFEDVNYLLRKRIINISDWALLYGAYQYFCEKKPLAALDAYMTSARFGQRVAKEHFMSSWGSIMQWRCQKSLEYLLVNEQLPRQTYLELDKALQGLINTPEEYRHRIDLLFALNMNVCEHYLQSSTWPYQAYEKKPCPFYKKWLRLLSMHIQRNAMSNDFFINYDYYSRLDSQNPKQPLVVSDTGELFGGDWYPSNLFLQMEQLSWQALRIICALRVYKLDHSAYPKRLEQLVPKYLPQLPDSFATGDGIYDYSVEKGKIKLFYTKNRRKLSLLRS